MISGQWWIIAVSNRIIIPVLLHTDHNGRQCCNSNVPAGWLSNKTDDFPDVVLSNFPSR
jgi:hypothetical protein